MVGRFRRSSILREAPVSSTRANRAPAPRLSNHQSPSRLSSFAAHPRKGDGDNRASLVGVDGSDLDPPATSARLRLYLYFLCLGGRHRSDLSLYPLCGLGRETHHISCLLEL